MLTAAACDEQLEKRYASLEEAKQDGAIVRGWIPAVLPESASDIVELHDLDTNETWGTFKFSPVGSEAFRAELAEPAPNELLALPRRPRVASWWPESLQGSFDKSRFVGNRFNIYRLGVHGSRDADVMPVFFAVNWEEGIAFFWRGTD